MMHRLLMMRILINIMKMILMEILNTILRRIYHVIMQLKIFMILFLLQHQKRIIKHHLIGKNRHHHLKVLSKIHSNLKLLSRQRKMIKNCQVLLPQRQQQLIILMIFLIKISVHLFILLTKIYF